MSLKVVILAAGKGRRMVSEQPKVLHQLGGYPLLTHVVRTAQQLAADEIYVVYGNGGSQVRETLSDLPVHWIEQQQQLGTGHAVMQAIPMCQDDDQVLVLYGDVPLISTETLQHLLQDTPANGLGLMVAELSDPTGFGRIVRNEVANIIGIVEHRDASDEQRHIKEINTGIMTAKASQFKQWLPKLQNKNKQQEYYLTDVVALAVESGQAVGGVMVACNEEIQGVNNRVQLAHLERYYQQRYAEKLMHGGVTLADPNRIDIRGDVTVGSDVTLDINVILEGNVTIGKHCSIGPNVVIRNSTLADHVTIKANSVIDGAEIAPQCEIGPFARIRPGTILSTEVRIGNFVEVKKSALGTGTKVCHLSYIGDAIVGEGVNVGAGCITCNYDGVKKWQTTIEDHAFIGSNTALVAPITISAGATIGAGSTITRNAPAEQLTLARSKQHTLKSWRRALEPDLESNGDS